MVHAHSSPQAARPFSFPQTLTPSSGKQVISKGIVASALGCARYPDQGYAKGSTLQNCPPRAPWCCQPKTGTTDLGPALRCLGAGGPSPLHTRLQLGVEGCSRGREPGTGVPGDGRVSKGNSTPGGSRGKTVLGAFHELRLQAPKGRSIDQSDSPTKHKLLRISRQ